MTRRLTDPHTCITKCGRPDRLWFSNAISRTSQRRIDQQTTINDQPSMPPTRIAKLRCEHRHQGRRFSMYIAALSGTTMRMNYTTETCITSNTKTCHPQRHTSTRTTHTRHTHAHFQPHYVDDKLQLTTGFTFCHATSGQLLWRRPAPADE
jgi:hypothetical protein